MLAAAQSVIMFSPDYMSLLITLLLPTTLAGGGSSSSSRNGSCGVHNVLFYAYCRQVPNITENFATQYSSKLFPIYVGVVENKQQRTEGAKPQWGEVAVTKSVSAHRRGEGRAIPDTCLTRSLGLVTPLSKKVKGCPSTSYSSR
jgi:hypothetical protein